MARKTRTLTVMICDNCAKSDEEIEITEHTVVLDGQTTKIDACDPCWTDRSAPLADLLALGRTRKKPGRKKAAAKKTVAKKAAATPAKK